MPVASVSFFTNLGGLEEDFMEALELLCATPNLLGQPVAADSGLGVLAND